MSQSQHESRRPDGDGEPDTGAAAQARPQQSDEEFDSLLDEIDGVLEVNAEEFVRSFVQKGGQ